MNSGMWIQWTFVMIFTGCKVDCTKGTRHREYREKRICAAILIELPMERGVDGRERFRRGE
jgi:hypothetical protein